MTATVRNAFTGAPVRIRLDLAGPSRTDPVLRLQTLTLELSDVGRPGSVFNVTVAVAERKPDLPDPPRGEVLGHVDVTSELDDDAVSEARVEFAVPAEALPDAGGRESVRLYRFDRTTGEWMPVGASYEADRGTYRARVGSLSPLAVVTLRSGSVEVLDAGGLADSARRSFATSVTARVANPGETNASRALTVTIDGDPVAERRITLGPGDRSNVSIQFEARPGIVAVEGVEAGRLQSADRPSPEGTPETEQGGFTVVVVLLVFTLLLVLIGMLSAYRLAR